METHKAITFDMRVNGKDELQDAADIIREIVPNVTVRNNQTVNFHMTVINFKAPGGDDDAES